MSRNKNRYKILNATRQHKELFENRKINKIFQYDTPILTKITPRQRASLTRLRHIWKTGDRFYKLASKHYGDPKLWWIIAWYNTAPTEAHLKIGDTIRIPFPLERVMRLMKVI